MTSRREVLSQLGFLSVVGGAVVALKPLKGQSKNGNNCQQIHDDQTYTGYYSDDCINQTIYYTVEQKTVTTICQNADGSTTYKSHIQLHGTA